MYLRSKLSRVLLAILAFIVFALPYPAPVTAAPAKAIVLQFDVTAVKADESVSIRTKDFPVRTKFTVRMDVVGKEGVNGTVVGDFNSDKGGTIEATYQIPASLKGKLILALRIESTDGYYAYKWFFNEDTFLPQPDPKAKPEILFNDVKKNTSVTIEAKNLPVNTPFWVRVGPYATFYKDYVFSNYVTTDKSGTVKFDITIPKTSKDAENIMVRMDGGGMYAINVYQNIDGGKAQPPEKLVKIVDCTLLYQNRIPALEPREDFDIVWTVQNTGVVDWDNHHVMYLFSGGTQMYKREDRYALPRTVKRGEVIDIAIDNLAPDKPGWYSTSWVVAQVANGDKTFCKLNASIFVKEP